MGALAGSGVRARVLARLAIDKKSLNNKLYLPKEAAHAARR
jgi:hypothetical protein